MYIMLFAVLWCKNARFDAKGRLLSTIGYAEALHTSSTAYTPDFFLTLNRKMI